MRFFSSIATFVGLASLANAQSSSLQRVTAFSAGPTRAQMHVYLPPNRQAKPPILIAIHYCQGTAQAFYSQTAAYARQADNYGFIIIYPSSGNTGGCWDVASTQSLTHNGGGDSKTIINMVAYAVANYGADANRVYVLGGSSGAMMGNVLAGAYPDAIKGISVYAGVPDGCFFLQSASVPGTGQEPGWNSQCAQGNLIKTAQQWGDQTRGYYPGYTGPRPKIALWHGVQDNVLRYANFGESLKQWSNVLGVSFSRNVTNNPQSGFTRMEYGDGTKLVGFSAQNYAHNVPNFVNFDIAWFGLNTRSTPTSTQSQQTTAATSRSMTSTTRVPTTSQSGTGGPAAPKWGQCGGQGWTGLTTCVSGSTCTYSNQWYSQCL